MPGTDVDIARNIRVTEQLKADLASSLGDLFQAMVKADQEQSLASLSALQVYCLLLAKRLGYNLGKLEVKTAEQVATLLKEGYPAEEFGDLTALKTYLEMKR